MTKVSLLNSFWILLNGSDYQIGEGYTWKKTVFRTAVAFSVAFPLFNLSFSQLYTGALPPKASLIRSIGNFTTGNYDRYALNRRYSINFHAADGKTYYLMDGDLNIEKIGNPNTGTILYVEGFILMDGHGFFWPTLIKELDGKTLLHQDDSNRSLAENRDPFTMKKLLWEYGLVLPLWLISLSNAIKLRNKFRGI
ncbi:hypothetical protein PQQ51_09305 [Paraburkholderia xenovorans]|uniref:hypothetical protein n=1 Tax=Paraburkholderia xenovorans TaxID=36873 RepID=UPI0038B6DA2B